MEFSRIRNHETPLDVQLNYVHIEYDQMRLFEAILCKLAFTIQGYMSCHTQELCMMT